MPDFTTLANVKDWLSVQNTGDDAKITLLISAATQFMKNYMSRDILSANYTEKYNGGNTMRMPLRNFPVTAISSLSVDGVTIPPAANSAGSGYLFDDKMIYLVGSSFGQNSPNGFTFSRGLQNVIVSYVAGYLSVPSDLEQACKELVASKYRRKDRIDQVSKNLGGEVVTFSIKDMPAEVKMILDIYNRVVPI